MTAAVHIERGGGGAGPVVVLLHGAGASGVVWDGVRRALAGAGDPPVVTLDLPGHGRSARLPHYSTNAYAAAIAEALPTDRPLLIAGHSQGGLIGLALADELFCLDIAAVLVLSMKLRWSPEELTARAARARSTPRVFAERDEALRRFAKVSGLTHAAWPVPDDRLATGIEPVEGGYRLRHDPRTGTVPPVSITRIRQQVDLVRAPIRLVTGADDAMAPAADLGELGPVRSVPGAGHNPHVSHPDVVAALIGEIARDAGGE
jgi:pimeloyl-ACP methyl ester carboxylesterase